MEYLPPDFLTLVCQFTPYLGYAPNGPSFATLVLGWVLCHGRRTLSGVVRAAGPFAPKSHDAYQNFGSSGSCVRKILHHPFVLLLVIVIVIASLLDFLFPYLVLPIFHQPFSGSSGFTVLH